MKRIEQLQILSKEHHQSLVLSQKAIKASNSGDMELISLLCKKIVNDFPSVWKLHFQIEEESIFNDFEQRSILENNSSENEKLQQIIQLCKKLQQEHLIMVEYYEQMKAGNYQLLGEFGILLKQHTRTEERQLFPLLENFLSPEELNKVYLTSVNYCQD
ncbi:MAG: hemerythrin domain-containing protein [Pseudomonadota bacterium]